MKHYFGLGKKGCAIVTTVASSLLLTVSEPVFSAVVVLGSPNAVYVGRPLPYYGYGYRTGHYYGGFGRYHNGYYYGGNRYYHHGYHRGGYYGHHGWHRR